MIFTERTITVVNNSATINKPLILYRGDKNIELKITIAESQFKFRNNDASNVIETTDASYAQLVINTPYNSPIFSEVAATKNGAVIFVITEAMIDEIREVGAYEIQIRLLDDNKQSRASIPPVSNAIEIREPIAIEDGSAVDSNVVNVAKVNRALATTSAPLEAFDSQGNYIKNVWGDGVLITDAALNKMEAGIDGVNKKIANNSSQIKETVEANVQNVINEKIADGSLGSLTIGDKSIKETHMSGKSIGIEQLRDELISKVSGIILSGSSTVGGGSLTPVYSINNESKLFSSNEQVTISFKILPKDATKITSVFVYILQGSASDSNANEVIGKSSPIVSFSEGTYLYSFNYNLGTLSQNYIKILPCIKYNSVTGNDTYIWDVTIKSSTNTVTPDYSYPYQSTVKAVPFSEGLPIRLLQSNSIINWKQLADKVPTSIVNKILTDKCIGYAHLKDELVETSYNWMITSKQCNMDTFSSRTAGFSVDTSNFTLNEDVTFEFEVEFEAGYFTAVGHWLIFSDNKDDSTSVVASNQSSLTNITTTDTFIKYSKTIRITNIDKTYCQFYARLKGLNDSTFKTFNIRKVHIIKSDGTIIKPMFSCFYNPLFSDGIVTTLENTVDQIATFKHIFRLEENINALQDEINSFNMLMPYKDKTIATFGDSIEQGSVAYGNWQNTTKEILKCNIINRGNSGGAIDRMWSIVQGETPAGTPDTLDDWSQIDVVTMKIGTNGGGISVGSLEDYTLSEGQTYLDYPNTYYGYYGKCIEYIWEQNPKIKIILMTPPMVEAARTSWVKPLADTTIREIAKHYGLGLIDIYYESGLSDKNFWWTNDEVHPNIEGNKILGNFIARKLLTF